jgi:hypothetical protein
MYKLMTLTAVLVALALAPVFGGVSADDRPGGSVDVREPASERLAAERAQIDESLTCDWTCQACEADQGCQQICTELGDCGSTCGVMARCDAQHEWSDEACACVIR